MYLFLLVFFSCCRYESMVSTRSYVNSDDLAGRLPYKIHVGAQQQDGFFPH